MPLSMCYSFAAEFFLYVYENYCFNFTDKMLDFGCRVFALVCWHRSLSKHRF